jgi:hypothetical protein
MCVDQGFPRSSDAHLILVGPISKRQAKKLAPNLRPYLLRISNFEHLHIFATDQRVENAISSRHLSKVQEETSR